MNLRARALTLALFPMLALGATDTLAGNIKTICTLPGNIAGTNTQEVVSVVNKKEATDIVNTLEKFDGSADISGYLKQSNINASKTNQRVAYVAIGFSTAVHVDCQNAGYFSGIPADYYPNAAHVTLKLEGTGAILLEARYSVLTNRFNIFYNNIESYKDGSAVSTNSAFDPNLGSSDPDFVTFSKLSEFLARNKSVRFGYLHDLATNPFAQKDRTLLLRRRFSRMLSENTAQFTGMDLGEGSFVITGVPADRFNDRVGTVVAARIDGLTRVPSFFGEEPALAATYVDSATCGRYCF